MELLSSPFLPFRASSLAARKCEIIEETAGRRSVHPFEGWKRKEGGEGAMRVEGRKRCACTVVGKRSEGAVSARRAGHSRSRAACSLLSFGPGATARPSAARVPSKCRPIVLLHDEDNTNNKGSRRKTSAKFIVNREINARGERERERRTTGTVFSSFHIRRVLVFFLFFSPPLPLVSKKETRERSDVSSLPPPLRSRRAFE